MTSADTITECEPRKRFIAGAVWAEGQGRDGGRRWEVDGVPNRDCVHCGYSDTPNADGNSVPNELATRVNVSALQKPKETKGQALQFFPNLKLKK